MFKIALIVLFLASIAYFLFGHIIHLGVYRVVYNHQPGECFQLAGIETGSEDMQALSNGQAFISSGLNFFGHGAKNAGRVYLFDFNNPRVPPVQLKIVGAEKFRTINPHGINIWTDPKTGDVYLYVVNHTPGGEAVDKFKFNNDKKTLEHVKRIENQPDFHSINDLIVVEEDKFYFTNYAFSNPKYEMYFNLHWGSFGFYDGKSTKLLEKGLLFPNGIAVSKDKKTLYVAHIGYEEMRVYKRNADNSVTFLQSVFLGTLVDNLDVDFDTGDIWTGAHPSGYQLFLRHFTDIKGINSPSHVLKIHFPGDSSSKPEITEVYSNDGSQISASTVAIRYKQGLLIGSVFREAVYCHLNSHY